MKIDPKWLADATRSIVERTGGRDMPLTGDPMSTREQIKIIDQSINELENQRQIISDQTFKLEESKGDLIRQLLLDENMLENTEWFIKTNSRSVYLDFNGHRGLGVMQEISDLCSTGWHSNFELEPGIEIRFDDNEVSLGFSETKLIPALAAKYKLKLVGTGIVDQLHQLKREVAGLEVLCHTFNLQ